MIFMFKEIIIILIMGNFLGISFSFAKRAGCKEFISRTVEISDFFLKWGFWHYKLWHYVTQLFFHLKWLETLKNCPNLSRNASMLINYDKIVLSHADVHMCFSMFMVNDIKENTFLLLEGEVISNKKKAFVKFLLKFELAWFLLQFLMINEWYSALLKFDQSKQY